MYGYAVYRVVFGTKGTLTLIQFPCARELYRSVPNVASGQLPAAIGRGIWTIARRNRERLDRRTSADRHIETLSAAVAAAFKKRRALLTARLRRP